MSKSDLPDPKGSSGTGTTPGKPEKDPKNKPETSPIGNPDDDPNEKKNTPPPHKQPHDKENVIHNRDQDPNHPANITKSGKYDATPRPIAEGLTVPPEEAMTEQEKEAAGGGNGIGPIEPSRHTSGPVETIEDQGIGPRTPYPTGNPPPPSEHSYLSQGIHKDDDHEGDTLVDGPNARTDEHGNPIRRTPNEPKHANTVNPKRG